MKQQRPSLALSVKTHLFREANSALIIKVMLTGLVLTCLFSLLPFFSACEELTTDVLRLHVVAHSDSAADQKIKLRVRDAVLTESARWYQNATDATLAEAALAAHLPEIEAAAADALARENCRLPVTATLTDSYFDTRDYEAVSLPAGKYRTLRVTIGEGAGKNWWCMVYPALCLPASQGDAVETDPDALSGLPENEREIVTQPEEYTVRFKLYEWYVALTEALDRP